MRSCLGLAVSLLVVLGGCSKLDLHQCERNEDCHADSICSTGFCIYDPLPRLRVEVSSDRARVGEVIRLDPGRSYLPGGGPLEMELVLRPKDAGEILPVQEGLYAFRLLRPHTSVEATLVARSVSGRESRWATAIAPLNSPPVVRLVGPDLVQPGERVVFEAVVEDPDGDPFEVEWGYEGEGNFVSSGTSAVLALDPVDTEGWHHISLRATDGLERGEASVSFQPRNAPPVIEEILVPGTVEHTCTERSCFAQARLEVVAQDVGTLSHAWFFRSEFPGQARIEGEREANPLVILEAPPHRRIAGTHQVEVHVRDAFGALSTASVDFTVGNRPPSLTAHDESVVHHEFVSKGRYRWLRAPGSVQVWEDPDGDPPVEVSWSSSDPRVRFSDPKAIDPWIEIEGDERLLGARIPVSVVARDSNGAEASSEALLQLGNRPPELVEFRHETAVVGPLGHSAFIDFHFEDPDGDPLAITVALDPEPSSGDSGDLQLVHTGGRWAVVSSRARFSAGLVLVAEDPFGEVVVARRVVNVQ